jgi:hypothetical protein
MVMFASVGVVLVVSVLGLPSTPPSPYPAASGERYEIPANIRIEDDVKKTVTALLARSPTLREQCARIEAAPHARIVVTLIAHRLGALTRARATAHRYEGGLLTVVIELPRMSVDEFAELLAHELEHVIELIDNVDMPELVRQRSAGVTRSHDGDFETDRAQAAGKAVAAEVETETDPAVAAIGRAVAKAARLAWRGLIGFTGIKSTP